ncbi:hypothetical protein OTU49_008263 [Cherax quadricarinatus]|uniref:DUF1279 domain-containing protein n=2 Tax=Cherax quadricarinatus TaxID=27406 RepID=A0AAW0WQP5_CHEQU
MLRSAVHRFFPAVKLVRGGHVLLTSGHRNKYVITDVCSCSSLINGYLLPAAAFANTNSWQQKRQLRSSYSHYHHPFTIARMTTGSIFHSSTSILEIVPEQLWALPNTTYRECRVRLYSTKPDSVPSSPGDKNHNEAKTLSSKENDDKTVGEAQEVPDEDIKEISLVQKFKLMYKQYWYVLIPVHLVTSIIWYGSFFLAAKSGVDIVPILEKLGAGENILSHLQNSNAGYYAIAYAMYKIATPARYTITIGGTTLAINYLKKRGYIKPVPSSEKLKEMYEGKKEEFIEKKEEMVGKYQEKKGELVDKYQERREEMVEMYQGKKSEMVQRVSDKRDEIKEKVSVKREELRDKMLEQKEKLDNIRDSMRKRR